jgi:calcium-dependent protein kinase
VVKKVEHKKTG